MALPRDALELISKKLTFDHDYTRFRSVCKSWRLAAPKRPRLPWLISYPRSHYDVKTVSVNFYQFSSETNKITRIPELSDSPLILSFIDKSNRCIGSSHGWLSLFNRGTPSLLLYNPLTNSTIDIPNLPKFYKDAYFWYDRDNFYLTSDPNESSADCFVVFCCNSRFSYCKVGNNCWIEVTSDDPKFKCRYMKICFYNGKLFVASSGNVFVYDFGQNSGFCKIAKVSLDDDDDMDSYMNSYLVESKGNLLYVLVYCSVDIHSYYFRVIKLEFEGLQVKLVELRALDNRALFLGQKIALSLPSSSQTRSVHKILITSEGEHSVQKLKVFRFEGYCILLITDNSEFYDTLITCDCTWFSPSLLK